MIKIIDTHLGIINLHKHYKNDDLNFMSNWRSYIDKYPKLMELCCEDASSYDIDEQVKPVMMNALLQNYHNTKILHDNFLNVIENIDEEFGRVFSIDEDIDIYFYIGLCNGAGWATKVNGRYAVLLGVEKIIELNWGDTDRLKALLYHELCHIAHTILRGESIDIDFDNNKANGIWQLYIEGYAQKYQQKIYGQEYYHQDKDGWLLWCKANNEDICREYLYRLENDLSTDDFYGDWNEYKGKSDVGYYLGCEFIKYLSKYKNKVEIAQLSMDEIDSLVIEFLKK